MRNSLKWVLPLACLATALPAAQAWHHHQAAPIIGAPTLGFGGQSYAVQALPAQSYSVQSYAVQALPAQSFTMQSYSLVPSGNTSQGLEAQGLDLATILGILGRINPGGSGGISGSSDVVRELQNNTSALKDNTAALKALTQAVKDNTGSSSSSTDTSNVLKQLGATTGVNAHALQAAQAAYAQDMQVQAEGLASKPAPATNPDLLTQARSQIKTANDAVQAARLFINTADTRNASDADEIKYLNDQLKKIGVMPAPAAPK